MRFATTSQMRELDRCAIDEYYIPGMVLMGRAGAAVARIVTKLSKLRNTNKITIVAGRGNNGGDAFVTAQMLHTAGFKVEVLMVCLPTALRGDARVAWEDMHATGVEHQVLPNPEDWQINDSSCYATDSNYGQPKELESGRFNSSRAHVPICRLPLDGIVVDGLLGTGTRGAPEGVLSSAIRWINFARKQTLVVSIDLPSGMNGDTGESPGEVVYADITVTLALPKKGLLLKEAQSHLGHLLVADIGIPESLIDRDLPAKKDEIRLIAAPELARLLPDRNYDSHKGDFGRLLIIGGSHRFRGAPILAALGALRSGIGLLTVAAPAEVANVIGAQAPETMVWPMEKGSGQITLQALQDYAADLNQFDAAVIGPGMTATAETREVLAWLLDAYNGQIVVDADGLNVLEGLKVKGPAKIVITPHPGEAARLLNCPINDLQADRVEAVRRLTQKYGCVAVLKGAGTLVCGTDQKVWLNLSGNAGMATGGSGDVLSGIIGALCARGIDALPAAKLGVWLHGTAGDFAQWKIGAESLIASDIPEMLPDAFATMRQFSKCVSVQF